MGLYSITYSLFGDNKMDSYKGFMKMTAADDAKDTGKDINLIGNYIDCMKLP